MSTTIKTIIILIPFLMIVGCYAKSGPSVTEVEKNIAQNLKPGDSSAKIETFLKQNEFPYNYDSLAKKYESSVPKSETTDSKGVKSIIGIDIYLNEERLFKKAEVREIYTYL